MGELRERIEAEIPRLRRYARALTRDIVAADDLVQDCLVRGLAKLHLWKEGTDLRAWLFTILHNQYVNQVRRAVREGAAVSIGEAKQQLSITATQDRHCLLLRDLNHALARLPEDQRVVILLAADGMNYETVAEVIGVPVGTVRSRLSRGREVLRQMMDGTPKERAFRSHRDFVAVAAEVADLVRRQKKLRLSTASLAAAAQLNIRTLQSYRGGYGLPGVGFLARWSDALSDFERAANPLHGTYTTFGGHRDSAHADAVA